MGGGHFSCRYHCSASISILIVFTVSNFPILAHFIHINGNWPNISDLKVRGMSTEGAAPCFQHGNHVLGVFGKNELFAISKAWINLSLGGNSLFHVFFIMDYQLCLGTSFTMDIWKNYFSPTCRLPCLSSTSRNYVTLLGNVKS